VGAPTVDPPPAQVDHLNCDAVIVDTTLAPHSRVAARKHSIGSVPYLVIFAVNAHADTLRRRRKIDVGRVLVLNDPLIRIR
jgi:hypothetical protein